MSLISLSFLDVYEWKKFEASCTLLDKRSKPYNEITRNTNWKGWLCTVGLFIKVVSGIVKTDNSF